MLGVFSFHEVEAREILNGAAGQVSGRLIVTGTNVELASIAVSLFEATAAKSKDGTLYAKTTQSP